MSSELLELYPQCEDAIRELEGWRQLEEDITVRATSAVAYLDVLVDALSDSASKISSLQKEVNEQKATELAAALAEARARLEELEKEKELDSAKYQAAMEDCKAKLTSITADVERRHTAEMVKLHEATTNAVNQAEVARVIVEEAKTKLLRIKEALAILKPLME